MHCRAVRHLAAPAMPPFVLVHGLGISSRYMVPIARCLGAHAHVYAPDLPGFGRSERPPTVLRISELADALIGWLDAARVREAHFLGNSLGGQILVDAAMRYPERFRALVLVGPTVDAAARSAPRQILRLMLDGLREPYSLVGIAVTDYLRTSPRRLWRTLQYAMEDPVEQKLTRVTAPCLVIRGDRDPLVPLAWAQAVADLLPRGELREVPGTHAVHYERARAISRIVLRFVGSRYTAAAS